MISELQPQTLPHTLEEFLAWEPEDGFKYEWNDGELIKFTGMKKREYFIFELLIDFLFEKRLNQNGKLISEADVMLTGIQMRRPDIAYFTKKQIQLGRKGEDVIPEFVIEIISPNDSFEKVDEKLAEYFKAGIKVAWYILPEAKTVYVYTSRREVKICIEDDICSAKPVLPEFELSVNQLFA